MALDSNRIYLRSLELYTAATGITPKNSVRNFIQYITAAIVEDINNNGASVAGQAVKVTLPSGYSISPTAIGSTNGLTSINGVTTADGRLK